MSTALLKVVLFIVEGDTDELSLYMILKKLLKNKRVFFQVVNTDVTSEETTTTQNIIKKLEQEIEKKQAVQKFYRSDIIQIIHLVDTDGAFVGDEHIVEADTESAVYTTDVIKTRYLEKMKKRNKRKSSILNKLSTTTHIEEVPYRVYYFSANLEHVLHNEQNVAKEQKRDSADQFADTYYDQPEEFINFIRDQTFAVQGTYQETWDFINNGVNSLNRHCNFHLFFEK